IHFFATVLLSLLPLIEIEQIEQVSDRRHVCRHVWIVARLRIRQIIATPIAQCGIEHPVPLDEFDEGGMLVIDVADMAPPGEGRNRDHRNARACPKEIYPLDEAGIIEAATLVYSHEDRCFRP